MQEDRHRQPGTWPPTTPGRVRPQVWGWLGVLALLALGGCTADPEAPAPPDLDGTGELGVDDLGVPQDAGPTPSDGTWLDGGAADLGPSVELGPADAAQPGDAAPDEVGAPPDACGDAGLLDLGPVDTDAGTRPDAADGAADPPDALQPPEGPSLFVAGCPPPGLARVHGIARPDLRAAGPDAVGGAGDWLLLNERAAFIVAGVERQRVYWPGGGILVDAVAVEQCRQTGPEQFDELALWVGRPDPEDLAGRSVLRGFFGERVEVVDDGAGGGPAHLRVHGRDDRFWLIEQLLLAEVVARGGHRTLSEPLGIEIWVDYRLEPASRVLRVELTARNQRPEAQHLLAAAALWYGDTVAELHPAQSAMTLSGYRIELGVPWVAGAGVDAGYAFAQVGVLPALVQVSGILGVVDGAQLLGPPRLEPAGAPGGRDAVTTTFLVAVGPTDADRAVQELHAVNPEPIRGQPYEPLPVAGRCAEEVTGDPVPGADVELQQQDPDGDWRPVTRYRCDAAGRWTGFVPGWRAGATEFRWVGWVPGRRGPPPLPFTLPPPGEPVLFFGPAGRLLHEIRDEADRPLPARVRLWQGGAEVLRFDTLAAPGEEPVPPGDYEVSVTRGYEYAPFQGQVTVAPGQPGVLEVVLPRVVATPGFLSVDGHLHAGPSPDSRVTIDRRIITAAAEGLEVAIATDHEAVADWSEGIAATGLGDWVATLSGSEITASLPGHVNAWPLIPDDRLDDRGGYVRWFGLDLAQLFAAARDRGARVVVLNHPRSGCGWLCLTGWDRVTATVRLGDPTRLGFPPGAALWSWDFDAVELQNGPQAVLLDPARPERTGLLDDWLSFQNHGHRVVALGASDTHGLEGVGTPRSYVEQADDEPAALDPDALATALLAGRVVISTGAFARVLVDQVAGPGDTVTALEGRVELALEVQALPEVDVTRVWVLANCDRVRELVPPTPGDRIKLATTLTLELEQDAHLVVLGFGEQRLPRGLPQFDPRGVPRFVVNPVFVDVDGNGQFDPPGDRACRYAE